MDSAEYHSALAALAWQVEAGVDAATLDAPVDQFALEAKPPNSKLRAATTPPPPVRETVDPIAEANAAAASASDLDSLRAALAAYPHCELAKGARSLVFSDGRPGARVMIVGEAPGRDEDRAGKPFVGQSGQLLDKMLAAIGLNRAEDVYITNVLPWRPPQNRDPKSDEIAMMRPFLARHIALADPDMLVIMGNISCQALLDKRGITRLRGTWEQIGNRPALPMYHPSYLLRKPEMKRAAWADLLTLKHKMEAGA